MPSTRRQFIVRSAATMAALTAAKQSAMLAAAERTGIAKLFEKDFYFGTAISNRAMTENDPEYMALVKREFNAMTMENDMKWERVRPKLDTWDWSVADKFVDFCEANNMYTVGHVLVWHSQVPAEVFRNDDGEWLNRAQLLDRMADHIHTLAGRYKGRIHAWDVVNEAVDEGNGWRRSPWYKIIGPDFMDSAFRLAHAAAPDAELLYNDYNMHSPAKRKFVVNFLREFKRRGVPIHGVGMQGHVGLGYPDMKEFEKSIEAYADQGLQVHITELDMDVLPVAWNHTGANISDLHEYSEELNPYKDGLPKDVEKELTDRYVAFFKLFLKHRKNIRRVTMWGTSDAESWKNNFPVVGRTNYPLLFDRQLQPKQCYHAIADLRR